MVLTITRSVPKTVLGQPNRLQCARVRALLAPCDPWLWCAVWVCVFGLRFRLRPATPAWAVRCGCVCSGSGFGCDPPLLAGVCGVWVGCCLAPVRVPWFAACCARSPRLWHLAAVAAWHLSVCLGCGRRRASLACLVAPRGAPRLSDPVALGAPVGTHVAVVPFPTPGACAPGFTWPLRGARGGRPRTGLFVPAVAPAEAGALRSLRVVPVRGPAMGLSLAGPSGVGLGLRALRWLACVDPVTEASGFPDCPSFDGGLGRCTGVFRVDADTPPLRVGGRHARVPCVCACACSSWPGRAGRPPGRVLVRLTFSFGRFGFLLCFAHSGLGLPPSWSFFFLLPSSARPLCLLLSLVSDPGCPGPFRCVLFVLLASCFSALRALSLLLCHPPGCWLLPGVCQPAPPFCVSRFSLPPPRSLCFFFLPCPRPRCLSLSLLSGPGCLGPWLCALRFFFLPPLGSPCALSLFFFLLGRWLLIGAWCPPPPFPLCLAGFVAAARCPPFFLSFLSLRAPLLSLDPSGFRPRVPWALALCFVCFVGLPLLGSPCALSSFCVSPGRWLLPGGCCPPPPCHLVLRCFFFAFCALVVSGFLWFPAPGALGLGAARCLLCWALRAFSPLSCLPSGRWLLPGGCCPPPLFVSRGFRRFRSVLCALCCAVLCVPGCCAALRCCALCRPVLCCCVLCCFGALGWCCCSSCHALWCSPSPWGPVHCGAVFCGVPPRCVCFVVAWWCVLLFAALLCAVCVLGCCAVRSLSSPLCAVLCFAVLVRLRCAVRVVRVVAGVWCCGALPCVVLFPLVCCGAVLGLVARGCLLVPCCGALLSVFFCRWCWFVSFPCVCGAVLRCASCCSIPVESALLSVPRAVACPCVLWCLPGRSAVWCCRSGVSWCPAVLCVVLWCPAPCAVSCGAVLPCSVVLVGCAVRLSALLLFVFPFVLFSFAKNPCCFSVPLKNF